MACLLRDGQHIRQRHIRRYIGIAYHKTGPIPLHLVNHLSLLLNGLGPVYKGNSAFLCKGNGHPVIRYRLHDGRNHRDIDGYVRFRSFLIFYQRRLQAHLGRDALGG